MKSEKDFIVFCRFSAIAKKIVNASSLEQAKEIAESDESINFEEIVRLTDHCQVDEVLLLKSNDAEMDLHEHVEYKSWGSE